MLGLSGGYQTSNYLTACASSGLKDHTQCAQGAAACWTREHPFGITTRDLSHQGTP